MKTKLAKVKIFLEAQEQRILKNKFFRLILWTFLRKLKSSSNLLSSKKVLTLFLQNSMKMQRSMIRKVNNLSNSIGRTHGLIKMQRIDGMKRTSNLDGISMRSKTSLTIFSLNLIRKRSLIKIIRIVKSWT